MYNTCPVAKSDKFPPTSSKVFIKLALVKKEKVSRADADKFTCLTLQGDVDQILQVKEPIEMDDILKAGDKVRLVVVEGAPGIGKSTLAWELCQQWPTLESLKRFSLVVLLRLREEGVQSAKHISDLFYHCDKQLSRHVGEEVEKREGDSVLFVFDGFDEFPSTLREKSLVMDIISGSKYLPKATVLVTSRPSASAQLQALLQAGIGKHIEVVGFTEKEILEFAHHVFGDTKLFTAFSTYLTAHPVVKGMMYNPLNCSIVVGVYQDTYESGKPVPHTQTQLYTELTLCLLLRYLKEKEHPLASKLPNHLEDLPHDSDLYQQLVKLGKLAFESKLKNEIIFKQLPEGCSDLGLLVEHTAMYTRKKTTTYNFLHLTLQEYMGAFYISQLLADEQRTLFREHSTSMDVVWRFVAGLTKMQHIGWNVFEWVKSENRRKALQYKVDIGVAAVTLLLLDCLYEAQDVKSFESIFSQYRLECSYTELSNYSLYALGFCISACSNTWSVIVRGMSREGPEMLSSGMKSVDYGGGSIEKLDFIIGCKGIMTEREHLLQIPHPILQCIKLLNLGINNIDQRGFDNLAECIPYLHSLTKLNISNNPGGDGSLVKLLQALTKHNKLQELYVYNISIGLDDVRALADLVQPSSSLKQLEVGESPLPGPPMAVNVAKELVKTVLSPSSLDTVTVWGCEYPLDDIETISVSINSLTFYYPLLNPLMAYPSRVKGGTKFSHILRENTSLKVLELDIPLDKDEVQDIIHSLKDIHSLVKLKLSRKYHSQFFSESEQQALVPRVTII